MHSKYEPFRTRAPLDMLAKNSRRPLTLEHKIKLKKQLSKAYEKVGYDAEDRSLSDSGSRPAFGKKHQRPSPFDAVIRKRQKAEEEREEARQKFEAEIQERKEKRETSIKNRKEQNRLHSTKTRRGQPNLNNQIDSILSKLCSGK